MSSPRHAPPPHWKAHSGPLILLCHLQSHQVNTLICGQRIQIASFQRLLWLRSRILMRTPANWRKGISASAEMVGRVEGHGHTYIHISSGSLVISLHTFDFMVTCGIVLHHVLLNGFVSFDLETQPICILCLQLPT